MESNILLFQIPISQDEKNVPLKQHISIFFPCIAFNMKIVMEFRKRGNLEIKIQLTLFQSNF